MSYEFGNDFRAVAMPPKAPQWTLPISCNAPPALCKGEKNAQPTTTQTPLNNDDDDDGSAGGGGGGYRNAFFKKMTMYLAHPHAWFDPTNQDVADAAGDAAFLLVVPRDIVRDFCWRIPFVCHAIAIVTARLFCGDVRDLLTSRLSMQCTHDNSHFRFIRSLFLCSAFDYLRQQGGVLGDDHYDVATQYQIEVDTRWGQYQICNFYGSENVCLGKNVLSGK
jgi:hypothetical protein